MYLISYHDAVVAVGTVEEPATHKAVTPTTGAWVIASLDQDAEVAINAFPELSTKGDGAFLFAVATLHQGSLRQLLSIDLPCCVRRRPSHNRHGL
jgi:hypothetical protein